MKIAVIGADGQLGTDLLKQDKNIVPLTISDLDVRQLEQVEKVLKKIRPDVVINTSGYHKVDDCEDHLQEAFSVNVFGPRNLALACKSLGSVLVHISTDYVFSGDKRSPYLEKDIPGPQTAYGISKLAGEQMIQYILPRHYIVRTSGLYGTAGCLGKGGINFVETILRRAKNKEALNVVDDEVVSTTYAFDLAKKILEIIPKRSYGIYHITNKGSCSWYAFAKKIFELLGMKVDLSPITGEEVRTKAKRPKYSALENGYLKKLGMDNMRPWDQALKAYLIEQGRLTN